MWLPSSYSHTCIIPGTLIRRLRLDALKAALGRSPLRGGFFEQCMKSVPIPSHEGVGKVPIRRSNSDHGDKQWLKDNLGYHTSTLY